MTAVELLVELKQRGVQLRAEDGRLCYRPKNVVTPELREAMVQHKGALLATASAGAGARPEASEDGRAWESI